MHSMLDQGRSPVSDTEAGRQNRLVLRVSVSARHSLHWQSNVIRSQAQTHPAIATMIGSPQPPTTPRTAPSPAAWRAPGQQQAPQQQQW